MRGFNADMEQKDFFETGSICFQEFNHPSRQRQGPDRLSIRDVGQITGFEVD